MLLANGPQQYKYYGDTVKTDSSFKLDYPHGQTSTLTDKRTHEIYFAAIFLLGKIPKLTKGRKEVIIVREFIHACGVPEHEKTPHGGIMYDIMTTSNGGLKEDTTEGEAMPPIRVGPQTLCRMRTVWSDSGTCEDK